METPPSDSSNKLWILPLLLLGVAASLLAAFWFAFQPILDKGPGANPPPPVLPVTKLSRDETLKLIELRNHAIGHLENHEFVQAEAALSEIIQLLPADPFGPRNLAICRQLAFDQIDKHRDQAIFERLGASANEAVEKSKAAEPLSFVPWVISSRVAVKHEKPDQGLSDLREAVRLGPESVGAAYDLFALLQSFPGDQAGDEGLNTLRGVFQREPNNLFVIKDWLPMLAQRKDPALLETLKQVRETISPFVETIKTNTRVDLNDILEKAAAAASAGNWPVVQRSTTIVKNLIIAEAARDKRYVMLDSLEYVLPDFGDEFRSRADWSDATTITSKPVHFVAPSDGGNWPRASEGRDVVEIDFDLNGRSDLLVLQNERVIAWGRETEERPWVPVANLETGGSYRGLLVCDFDDDVDQDLKSIPAPGQPADAIKHESFLSGLCHSADPDVILFGADGLKLLENKKDPASQARMLVTRSAGNAFDEVRGVVAAAVADIDNDGDVDLIVSTTNGIQVFSNRGNLTFEQITHRMMPPPAGTEITAFAILDWDRDSDIDFVVATTTGAGWLENLRHGRLRYRSLDDFSVLKGATHLGVDDFDGNTSWDLVASGPTGAAVVTTHRTPAGIVTAGKANKLASTLIRSSEIGDFNNDGASDIVLLSDTGATIHTGDGSGRFPNAAVESFQDVSSLAVTDFDRDGDLDLVTLDPNGLGFLSSQCRESDNPENGFLEIQLLGFTVKPGEQNSDKRTNHINLGGVVELKSGQRYQARVVTKPLNHFGLGAREHADIVRVLWTNGIPTNLIDPDPDQPVCIEQKLAGSCPYLYTWNGERFEFVTDLLWNAPLGLKFAETVVAPWREWEYIKIEGDKLKAQDQEYQLRITAELWEAEYFDQVKLFAIDHPAGTNIFTNEKVGPPAIAAPRIHTVQVPRKPVAARDTWGHDILEQVAARDENYTRTFRDKAAQGLTEEHFLELDLGEFPPGKKVMLYLTGWMYPGTTSLSVQNSQNPDRPTPRPPAVMTPDANGEWQVAIPFMGFPGGKTKTIAVDLSDVFASVDHRLRIVSTMELHWDAAFFTVDDQPVEMRQTELTLTRAELVDRGGVSFHSWPASGNGPDQFDYHNLVPGEQWPAMSGNFTRFGDVKSLLIERDDKLVVSGSGDEIQLSFKEPAEALPAGWVRDFVLYTVGWDKDADLNTVYGDTVEPLPFGAMTVYAHRDGEARPLDAEYVKYLRDYQTRQRNPTRYWKSVQQWKRQ